MSHLRLKVGHYVQGHRYISYKVGTRIQNFSLLLYCSLHNVRMAEKTEMSYSFLYYLLILHYILYTVGKLPQTHTYCEHTQKACFVMLVLDHSRGALL